MIKNYFKIAWRSLWKHKAYSAINIAGLSIGLTACLIVATVVFDELSYDRQWSKGNNLYRVLSVNNEVKGDQPMAVAFAGLGPSLKKDFPEVESYCRMSTNRDRLKMGDDKDGVLVKAIDAEATIWDVLDFKITQGNPRKFVAGYVNLVITEKIRKQYFAHENPIGKWIENSPTYGKAQKYLITGVIKEIPQNSHLRADIITLAQYKGGDNEVPKDGYASFFPQYVLLKPGTSVDAFTKKVDVWYEKQLGKKADYKFKFQPIKDIYLKSDFDAGREVHGNIRNVYIFAGVAVLLLLIACINFINLTVSRVFYQAKETGIRKVLGAGKAQLIVRFLSESLIFFVVSFIVAFVLYPVFLKPVEGFLGHELILNLRNSTFLLTAVCLVLITSLLTGLYPAWFLSRPQPIVILRDKLKGNVQLNLLKKVLVVGQFVISVAIIIVTIVVHNQIDFMSKKDLGFNKNNLLSINYTAWGDKSTAFKNAIKQIPNVENAAISEWYPGSGGAGNMSRTVNIPGSTEKINAYYIEGDADMPVVLGLKVKSGRLLSSQIPADAMNGDSAMNPQSQRSKDQLALRPIIATAYTANLLQLKLNTPYKAGAGGSLKSNGVPVGIVEDFNSESLHTKLQPTFVQAIDNPDYGAMLVRVKPGHERQVLTDVNKKLKEFYPEKTVKSDWVGDLVDAQYDAEHKLQQLFTCFSVLIVFLACLGLFGLVTFTAEQRVKEIGIRKVLGASVTNINALISKDYVVLVAIAIFVASPIAWYAMQKWLQDFAYRIDIQWWVFVLASVITLIIALITISFQTIKAALANPAKSLRSE